MRTIFSLLALLLLALQLTACKEEKKAPEAAPAKPSFRHDGYAEILDAAGKLKATIKIEVVSSEKELMQGLKFREQMNPDEGMLFVFTELDYHSFWMQDTYLSLDMLFIDETDNIFQIVKSTSPFSEEQIMPEKPNRYVLELIAGSAEKYNIKETDKLQWYYKKN